MPAEEMFIVLAIATELNADIAEAHKAAALEYEKAAKKMEAVPEIAAILTTMAQASHSAAVVHIKRAKYHNEENRARHG